MALSNFSDFVKSKATVSFTTKNLSDTTQWVGKIIASTVSYDIAKNYTDVQTYHNTVCKYDTTIDKDCKNMIYFILQLDDKNDTTDTTTTNTYAFAYDWLTDANFQVIANYEELTVTVYVPQGTNNDTVIDVLSSVGYPCKIVS